MSTDGRAPTEGREMDPSESHLRALRRMADDLATPLVLPRFLAAEGRNRASLLGAVAVLIGVLIEGLIAGASRPAAGPIGPLGWRLFGVLVGLPLLVVGTLIRLLGYIWLCLLVLAGLYRLVAIAGRWARSFPDAPVGRVIGRLVHRVLRRSPAVHARFVRWRVERRVRRLRWLLARHGHPVGDVGDGVLLAAIMTQGWMNRLGGHHPRGRGLAASLAHLARHYAGGSTPKRAGARSPGRKRARPPVARSGKR